MPGADDTTIELPFEPMFQYLVLASLCLTWAAVISVLMRRRRGAPQR